MGHVHIDLGQDHFGRLRTRLRFQGAGWCGLGCTIGLACGIKPGNRGAHSYLVAGLRCDPAQITGFGCLDLHRRLIRFDVKQRSALLHHLPLGHMPGGKGAMGHVHIDLGQDHFDGHALNLAPDKAAGGSLDCARLRH